MNDVWDWFWLMIWWVLFVAYLVLLWQICGDLFRDRDLSGWWKALRRVAQVVRPRLSLLGYVIARGRGMAERHAAAIESARRETDAYIRQTAGRSPADEIADAKALLDQGVIDTEEFGRLKARALAV